MTGEPTPTPTVPPDPAAAGAADTPGTIFKRLGPASILAIITLTMPAIGGFLVLGFMDTIADWLTSHGSSGIFIYAIAFAVFAGLALLPTYSQSILGGWAFGIANGFSAALSGFVVGSIIGYFVSMAASGERVVKLIDERPTWAAVREALVPDAAHAHGRGWRGFLHTLGMVTLLRLPPNSPFAATNLLLASVRVPLPIYILGTAIGMAPRTFAAVWLGHTLHQQFTSIREGLAAPKPWWMLAVGIALMFIILGIIGMLAQRAIERVTRNQAERVRNG